MTMTMRTTSALRFLALTLFVSPLTPGCVFDSGSDKDAEEDDDGLEDGAGLPTATLTGDWFGELSFDEGASTMLLGFEQSGDRAEGVGAYDAYCDLGEQWVPCMVLFEFDAYLEAPTGAQEVEIDPQYCVVELGGDIFETGCDDPFTVNWDGWDDLSGDFGGGDLFLERAEDGE